MTSAANHPMAWADEAACIGMDPERFYTARGEVIDPEVIATCAGCPVRPDCLAWALRHEKHGFWAGMSERGRRKLRRSMGIRLVEPEPITATEDIAS